MNREDKIFQVYLHLLQTKPDWSAVKAAQEAIDVVEFLECSIAHRQRIADIERMLDEKKAVWHILNLSVRASNNLWAEEIYTLDDLCRLTERQVLNINNMGRRSLNEIKEALAKIGRQLGEKR